MILTICVVVDESKCLDILIFRIFNKDGASSILTWVQPDTASAACPAQPGSLDVTSITFAAVICEADDPCSLNTVYEPDHPL